MNTTVRHTTYPSVALAAALLFGLSACGSDDTDTAGSPDAAASSDGVTISHQYGETHIDGIPEHPVAIGASWADALVKLDVPITGEFVAQSASAAGDRYAWTPAHDSKVSTYRTGSLPGVEEVAALHPDVILVGALSDEKVYEQYSDIAPVVPVMAPGVTLDNWRDVATTAGKIFDKEDAAKDAVADVEHLLAETKDKHPAVQGKTFAYGQLTPNQEFGVVTDPASPAARILSDVGLTLSPALSDLAGQGDKGGSRQTISAEQVSLLDTDVLVFWPLVGGEDAFAKIPGWKDLRAVRSGATTYLDNSSAPAFVTPTIYSVPWAVQKLTPALDALEEAQQ